MVYDRDTVVGLNTEDGVVVDLVVGDELHNSEDGLVKNLTHYDVRTSSLVYFLFIVIFFSIAI